MEPIRNGHMLTGGTNRRRFPAGTVAVTGILSRTPLALF